MKRQLGKRLILVAGAVLFSIALMELGAVAVYWSQNGKAISREEIGRRLTSPLPFEAAADPQADVAIPQHVSNKILHPYLGFVYGPVSTRVNSFGFFGPEPSFERSEDALVVAIFGGSVALQFCGESIDALSEELGAAKAGRTLRADCFAVDGYKQPQQLLALAYMLSLGAKFDVAVNLDGFNEIALPILENVPQGVFVGFPRAWELYSAKGFQPEIAARTAGIAEIRSERVFWRRLFARWPLRGSLFCLALWDRIDRSKDARETRLNTEIRSLLAGGSKSAAPGTPDPSVGEREALSTSVRIWKDSSLQMAALCRANGIRYFHFLQPNQYVPQSKRFTEEETSLAFGEAGYRSAVERAYPVLRREGAELASAGVRFFDLTGVFADHKETLYKDACCHFNARGSEILGRAVGRRIRLDLESVQSGSAKFELRSPN